MSKLIHANPGWLFYRDYFEGFFTDDAAQKEPEKFFERKNKQLYDFNHLKYRELTCYQKLPKEAGYFGFSLRTTYPGLLVGTGYTHDIAEKGATKIGFYFDHTTGLPTIPGSSIKGVLRSVFPGLHRDKIAKGKETEQRKPLLQQQYDYLKSVISAVSESGAEVNETYIDRLEKELFAGVYQSDQEGETALVAQIPMSQRFICHDAVVIATQGGLLAPDFITPHKEITKEPNPIQLLKVLPGVDFQMTFQCAEQYRLRNDRGEFVTRKSTLNKAELNELCKQILLDFGAGAKTNVGYGRFEDPATKQAEPPKSIHFGNQAGNTSSGNTPQKDSGVAQSAPPAKPFNIADVPLVDGQRLKPRKPILAQIVAVTGSDITVKLHTDAWDKELVFKYFRSDKPAVGSWGDVMIKAISGKHPKIKNILLDNNKFDLRS